MRFRAHLISALAAGLALYPSQPGRQAALVAAGTLVDLDHLLLYMFRTGDWSVSGAICYDRYRNRWAVAGDSRPRYGPLRSWLHRPLLVLPLLWPLAARRPALRPVALGVSLHLLLDHYQWPVHYATLRRANGVCGACGRADGRLRVARLGRRGEHGYWALCRACLRRAARIGGHPPGPPPEGRLADAGEVP